MLLFFFHILCILSPPFSINYLTSFPNLNLAILCHLLSLHPLPKYPGIPSSICTIYYSLIPLFLFIFHSYPALYPFSTFRTFPPLVLNFFQSHVSHSKYLTLFSSHRESPLFLNLSLSSPPNIFLLYHFLYPPSVFFSYPYALLSSLHLNFSRCSFSLTI